jgi:hypothetical protein
MRTRLPRRAAQRPERVGTEALRSSSTSSGGDRHAHADHVPALYLAARRHGRATDRARSAGDCHVTGAPLALTARKQRHESTRLSRRCKVSSRATTVRGHAHALVSQHAGGAGGRRGGLTPTFGGALNDVPPRATLVIRHRLANLLGTVHDEWSVPHDKLVNRLATEQKSGRVFRAVDADALPGAVE